MAVALCVVADVACFLWQMSADAMCDVSARPASYSVMAPHMVQDWAGQQGEQPAVSACRWSLRNASEVLPNVPRKSLMRERQRPLLHLVHHLWSQRGLLIVPRRGSALEVYRGRRGDVDLDFFLVFPASMSMGCLLRNLRAAVDSSGLSGRIHVASSAPFNYFLFDRFLPAMLRTPETSSAKIDVELVREDLLFDADYVSRMRAVHGNAHSTVADFFTSRPCLCTLDDVAPDAPLLCMDDPDMRRHLEAAYSDDFMIPRDFERHADFRNLRAVWRLPVVSHVFNAAYAWVSYVHKMLGPPQTPKELE